MSGRGKWWDVKPHGGVNYVDYVDFDNRPTRFKKGIDNAVALMAHKGDADAIAAVLECPDDNSFQAAVKELE